MHGPGTAPSTTSIRCRGCIGRGRAGSTGWPPAPRAAWWSTRASPAISSGASTASSRTSPTGVDVGASARHRRVAARCFSVAPFSRARASTSSCTRSPRSPKPAGRARREFQRKGSRASSLVRRAARGPTAHRSRPRRRRAGAALCRGRPAGVCAASRTVGLAPLEAMACATPVVAVAEGGVPETVVTASPAGSCRAMRARSARRW